MTLVDKVQAFAEKDHLYTVNIKGEQMYGLCQQGLRNNPPPQHPLVTFVRVLETKEDFMTFVLGCFESEQGSYMLEYIYDFILIPAIHEDTNSRENQLILEASVLVRMLAHGALANSRTDAGSGSYHARSSIIGQSMLNALMLGQVEFPFVWNDFRDTVRRRLDTILP